MKLDIKFSNSYAAMWADEERGLVRRRAAASIEKENP